MSPGGWKTSVVRAAVGTLVVALLTFAAFKLRMDLASAMPLYMLLVVVQSMTGDLWSAAVVSILSAACLDFFFTEPLFRLYVSDPREVLALIAFIFTALVITRLVSRVRAEATSAKLQKGQLDRLYALSRQLLVLEPEGMMTLKFLEPYHRLFGVTAICAFDAQTAEVHLIGASRELTQKTRQAYIAGRDLNDPHSHLSVRCLRVSGGGKMTGAIGFEGLRESEEVTGALAALTAALVERTKAFRNASVAAAAAQAEIYRSAVLDALAHEFKTPLATILAAAGGIREIGPLGPEQQDMAETVESEAIRLSSLTSRLLRTARLDRENIRPRMETVDLVPLVSRIVSQYSERSPDREILQTGSSDPLEVLADPQLLRIAVSQLVENACKYSAPGSSVTVALDRQGDYAAVRVTNTGSAIPYNERGKIFDRFYRGDAGRSTSGSGLGLFVARKIAIAHQGALELEDQNRLGGPVTFCLTIPVKKETADRVPAA